MRTSFALLAALAFSACDYEQEDAASFGGFVDVPPQVTAGVPFSIRLGATQSMPIASAEVIIYSGDLGRSPASPGFSGDTLSVVPVDVKPGLRTFETAVMATVPVGSVSAPSEEVGVALVVHEFPCSGPGPACGGPASITSRTVAQPGLRD